MNSKSIIVVITMIISMSISRAVIYSGSLSSDGVGTDGTLTGTEQWSTGALFSWTVSDENGPGWQYSYTLTVLSKDISHVAIEVSDTFELSNLLGDIEDPGNILHTGALDLYGPGLHGNSDPGIPDTMYGIKWDTSGDTTSLTWSFFSDRVPVWGDMYAKSGSSGGPGGTEVYIHNTGFTPGDTDPDINVFPAANGSVDNHVLVPDSITDDPEGPGIPEPSTAVLGIIGMMMILRRRWK